MVLLSSCFINFDCKTPLSCTGDKSLFLFASLCFATNKKIVTLANLNDHGAYHKQARPCQLLGQFITRALSEEIPLTFLFCLLFSPFLLLEIAPEITKF